VLGVLGEGGEDLRAQAFEAGDVAVQVRLADAGMRGHGADAASGVGQAMLELEGEQQVGQLGVAIGLEGFVGPVLAVQILGVDVAPLVHL
jgi:hypothetical protein